MKTTSVLARLFSSERNPPARRADRAISRRRSVCSALIDTLEPRTMLSANPLADATALKAAATAADDSGTPGSSELVFANLAINGTAGDDFISLTLADGLYTLAINGSVQTYDPDDVDDIEINGLGGSDTFQLTGTSGVDTVTMIPGAVQLVAFDFTVTGFNFELIQVETGGGNDAAFLFDSVGNDEYYGNANSAAMLGPGYSNETYGFRRVYGYSYEGGNDIAYLNDSAGNDRFITQVARSWMTSDNYYNSVSRFERVYGYAYSGGFDQSIMYDSVENDFFVARDIRSTITSLSGAYYASASRFEASFAHSVNGGADRADLRGTIADDTVISHPVITEMFGGTYFYQVSSFENVNVLAGAGGNDYATLVDSAGDDHFYDNDTANEMVWANGVGLWLFNFGEVDVRFQLGGYDIAEFRSLTPSDFIDGIADEILVSRSNGKTIYAEDMEEVIAVSDVSPGPQTDLDAIDYFFTEVGNW